MTSQGRTRFNLIIGVLLLIILWLHLGVMIRLIFSMIGIYVLVKLIEWVWIKTVQDREKNAASFMRWLFGRGNSLFNIGN